MSVADRSLLDKVVKSIREPSMAVSGSAPVSLLAAAARFFASRPAADDVTVPTGFDPLGVALFEAIVEAAYLVATADGEFDETERETFEAVLTEAAGGVVDPQEIRNLVADFADQLHEDGLDLRIRTIGGLVPRPDAQQEVLRIASLMAEASGGVSDVERRTLARLATAFGLGEAAADRAIAEVRGALA